MNVNEFSDQTDEELHKRGGFLPNLDNEFADNEEEEMKEWSEDLEEH